MNSELLTGLSASLIGILTVFGVLAILAIAVYLLRYVSIPHRAGKAEEKPPEEKEVVEEKHVREIVVEGERLDSDKLSLITAAVLAFNEYKKKRLERYELFRDFPGLKRLLPLAGVYFSARLRVSSGGVEKEVEVREKGLNTYTILLDGREYTISVKIE